MMRCRLAVSAVLALACASDQPVHPGDGLRILFIGNSLTSVNDLPAMVAAIAQQGHVPIAKIEAVLRDGYGLVEHWDEGTAQDRITSGRWDFVVLQQGPSALPESRAILVEYVKRYDPLIRSSGAQTVMYAVWPEGTRRSAFDSVSASYRAAALEVGGRVAPAGDAWLAAWRRDPSIALYGDDGFHPSALGTHLAALVVYATLFDRSPVGAASDFVADGHSVHIDAATAMILQQAAAEVTH